MSRPRRPEDWERDLQNARRSEGSLRTLLSRDARIEGLEDHTASFDKLDFSFLHEGERVWVDLKEKIRPSSSTLAALWPAVARSNLFVLDETVYRRIVWQGGGGYLLIHDHPEARWVVFGPWELTLGPKIRFRRAGTRVSEFSKGKILLDLTTAVRASEDLVGDLLAVVATARRRRDQVEAVEIPGHELA